MKIMIDYDSCWQTSFLEEQKDALPKLNEKRKFIATSKTRGERETPISDDTVLGVLCRLIGDQRKLSQTKNEADYFFRDIEKDISWKLIDNRVTTTTEIKYLTNKSDDRCAQSTWLGVISDDEPWFFSETAPLLWSVLFLQRSELLDFLLGDQICKFQVDGMLDCRPTNLLSRISLVTDSSLLEWKPWKNMDALSLDLSYAQENLSKQRNRKDELLTKGNKVSSKTSNQREIFEQKLLEIDQRIKKCDARILEIAEEASATQQDKINFVVSKISEKFPSTEYWKNGALYPMSLYSAALYIQAERLLNEKYPLHFAVTEKNEIQIKGFAKGGFNGVRDWFGSMTGRRKKSVGTPCQVTKQTGQLEITIDVNRSQADDIISKIENAGVSSFYLGKKGLAYVSNIRV